MNNNTIDDNLIGNENNIVFYTDEENNVNVEVILQNENVWLNIDSLTKLFKIDRTGITRHINNIYKDEELEENSTCAKIAQVQKEGNRSVTRNISYYNLDMIISIGFRVNSKPAIKFRTWANKIIKEYMIKGFALNDDRFINGNKFDTRYFDELILTGRHEKGPACRENNIDIMIEDSIKNCEDIENNGVKCYIMNTRYNQEETRFERVKRWNEIYSKISKLYQKEEHKEKINVILDTDTYNECDDQFALSSMLLSQDRFKKL